MHQKKKAEHGFMNHKEYWLTEWLIEMDVIRSAALFLFLTKPHEKLFFNQRNIFYSTR